MTEAVDRMLARLKVQEIAPTIVTLQEQWEQVRQAETAKFLRKPGAFTPEQVEAVEALTRSIVNKLAHAPISEMRRQAGQPEGAHIVEALRKVFRLE